MNVKCSYKKTRTPLGACLCVQRLAAAIVVVIVQQKPYNHNNYNDDPPGTAAKQSETGTAITAAVITRVTAFAHVDTPLL